MNIVEAIIQIKNKKEFHRLQNVLLDNNFVFLFSDAPESYFKATTKAVREVTQEVILELRKKHKIK